MHPIGTSRFARDVIVDQAHVIDEAIQQQRPDQLDVHPQVKPGVGGGRESRLGGGDEKKSRFVEKTLSLRANRGYKL